MDYLTGALYHHLIFYPWFLINRISKRRRPHRFLILSSYIPLPEILEIGLYSELPVIRTSKRSRKLVRIGGKLEQVPIRTTGSPLKSRSYSLSSSRRLTGILDDLNFIIRVLYSSFYFI